MIIFEQLNAKEKILLSVPLELIRTNGGTQFRSELDANTVDSYLEAMKNDAEFPALETVFDGQVHWLFDGFHRLNAMQRIGMPNVPVRYIEGTLEDAKLLALTVNANHGLQRNHATKQAIGLAALSNPILQGMSNYEIAKITGLSQPFIASLRNPDLKAKQQDARNRSAIKKVISKTANPISNTEEFTTEGTEDFSPEDVGPSDDELVAAEDWANQFQATLAKLMDEDETLKNTISELEKLTHQNEQLRFRLNAVTNEKNVYIKIIKTRDRQIKKLESEIRAFSPSKGEIRLDAQIASFNQNLERIFEDQTQHVGARPDFPSLTEWRVAKITQGD